MKIKYETEEQGQTIVDLLISAEEEGEIDFGYSVQTGIHHRDVVRIESRAKKYEGIHEVLHLLLTYGKETISKEVWENVLVCKLYIEDLTQENERDRRGL